MNEWWEKHPAELSIRPKAVRNIKSMHSKRISPHLGHMALGEIDESALLIFRRRMQDEGLKNSTVNRVILHLCGSLGKAAERELIPRTHARVTSV